MSRLINCSMKSHERGCRKDCERLSITCQINKLLKSRTASPSSHSSDTESKPFRCYFRKLHGYDIENKHEEIVIYFIISGFDE